MTERLFLAVPLTETIRADLDAHLRRSVPERLPGRPVPARSWHLTLRFLGDTTPDAAGALRAALAETALGTPFSLRFDGFGAFPREARASVLWLGVAEGGDGLGRLAAAAGSAARAAGFAPETRPFRPHLTLARLPRPLDLRPLIGRLPPFPASMPVSEIVLYRSRLGDGPARYDPLARFPLE